MNVKTLILYVFYSILAFTTLTSIFFGVNDITNQVIEKARSQNTIIKSVTDEYINELSVGNSGTFKKALTNLLYKNSIQGMFLKNHINTTNIIIKPHFINLENDMTNNNCIPIEKLSFYKVLFLDCIKQEVTVFFDSQKISPMINLSWKYLIKIKKSEIIQMLVNTLLFSCFGLLLSFFIYYYLKSKILVPLQYLTENLEKDKVFDTTDRNLLKAPSELLKLAGSLDTSLIRIKSLNDEIVDQAQLSTKVEVSKQVAHDIRSPLAALSMITKELDELEEDKRLIIRSSVARINDIANNLLQGNKDNSQNDNIQGIYLLAPILDEIVSEKRTQLRSRMNISIELDINRVYGAFSSFNKSDLKRVISNLINNSLDAFGTSYGKITVSLSKNDIDSKIIIKVSDNGKGIPEHIIAKIGQKGFSFGKEKIKESGSGLGLFHARTCIESWGGEFSILSESDKGTDIILSLSIAEDPSWFVEKLNIVQDQKIVIIDDDTSIHQVWYRRFNDIKLKYNLDVIHFTDPDEVSHWINSNNVDIEKILFLCDYEFIGFDKNGLQLIDENAIAKRSILVSSRYEEDNIRQSCNELGVKLIPKMMVEYVPLIILEEELQDKVDLIHLDDDDLIRMCWNMSAKKNGKNIASFSNPAELKMQLSKFSKNTAFYIDSSLGEDIISGQDFAKELFGLGYKNLCLSTGYEKEKFENMPWIKDVISKSPPWDSSVH